MKQYTFIVYRCIQFLTNFKVKLYTYIEYKYTDVPKKKSKDNV